MDAITPVPALDRPDLLAAPVLEALQNWKGTTPVEQITVIEIDPELADTAAFCERYGFGLEESANCVVIAGKRGEDVRMAACMVLATTRADVNGFVRKQIDARKASFAPMDEATGQTSMEYGGITPVGLPEAWPILIDGAAAAAPRVVIGSGLRRSKLLLPGATLAELPNAIVIEGLAK